MGNFEYVGAELGLFARAIRWKRYWSSFVRDYLRGDVLEVGAGIGANSLVLRDEHQSRWVCLEPDETTASHLKGELNGTAGRSPCEVISGTITDIPDDQSFDAICYLDVLEHIEDDRGELRTASRHLKPGGRLIVLVPAVPLLFSEFDASIGHFRRYKRKTLTAIVPESLDPERMVYLDSVGLCASLSNRLLLRETIPTLRQIKLWDGIMVPLSRWVDPLLSHRVGRSLLGVWRVGQ